MPILGVPLALIGLAALPALTAIYWLRTRFRRQEVSSLFLWSLIAQAHGGGRRATRLQTPLLWLLELLALLLLALAAAGPRIPRADRAVPVMVVLDDSFSMTATHRDGRSARQAGVDAIKKELGALGPFAARFVVAGPQPALVGGAVSRVADIDKAIEEYKGDNSQLVAPATGLPAVTVPMGYSYGHLPVGLQILGRPYAEGLLIGMAYAYEQRTQHRVPPELFPELD